jgi:transcriptional regulator of arginine metabolism
MKSESRIHVLQRLLREGKATTQEDLRLALQKLKYEVTQSTVSRDLRRIGAIRMINGIGQAVYKLASEDPNLMPPTRTGSLVLSVKHNGIMIVVNTLPGTASLLARKLDWAKPTEILGTIAGDDTIFIAPSSPQIINEALAKVESLLNAN